MNGKVKKPFNNNYINSFPLEGTWTTNKRNAPKKEPKKSQNDIIMEAFIEKTKEMLSANNVSNENFKVLNKTLLDKPVPTTKYYSQDYPGQTVLEHIMFHKNNPEYQKRIGILVQRNVLDISNTVYPFHIIATYVPLLLGQKTKSKRFFTLKAKGVERIVRQLVGKGHDINKRMFVTWPRETTISPLESMIEKYYRCKGKHRAQFQDIVDIFIKYGAKPLEVPRHVRNGVSYPKKMEEYVSHWTLGEGYRFQHLRRGTPEFIFKTEKGFLMNNFRQKKLEFAKKIEKYMSQFLRNSALLTPQTPLTVNAKNLKLYRGLHGPLAEQMVKQGMLSDNQYMAFSRATGVSKGYINSSHSLGENWKSGSVSFMLVIKFTDIPHGTPLIWFKDIPSRKMSQKQFEKKHRSQGFTRGYHVDMDLEEVILPPGTLVPYDDKESKKLQLYGKSLYNLETWKERDNFQNLKIKDPIRIRYIPDLDATNLTSKRIIRPRNEVVLPRRRKKRLSESTRERRKKERLAALEASEK